MQGFKNHTVIIGSLAAIFSLALVTLFFVTVSLEKDAELAQLRKEMRLVEDQMSGFEASMSQVYALSHNLDTLTRIQENGEEGSEAIMMRARKAAIMDEGAPISTFSGPDANLLNRFAEMQSSSKNLEKKLRGLATLIRHREDLLSSIPSITPTEGYITSTFGHRLSPFTGDHVKHNGIDIGAPLGANVLATADGEVIYAGEAGAFGRVVVIDHGFGIITRYAHNSRLLVETGTKISRGASIAVVGSSGRSTGPHLHYEVIVEGKPVDPRGFMLDMPTEYIQLANTDGGVQTALGGDAPESSMAGYRKEHRFLFPLQLAMYSVALALVFLMIPALRMQREQAAAPAGVIFEEAESDGLIPVRQLDNMGDAFFVEFKDEAQKSVS